MISSSLQHKVSIIIAILCIHIFVANRHAVVMTSSVLKTISLVQQQKQGGRWCRVSAGIICKNFFPGLT